MRTALALFPPSTWRPALAGAAYAEMDYSAMAAPAPAATDGQEGNGATRYDYATDDSDDI